MSKKTIKTVPCVVCGDLISFEIIGVEDPDIADVYKVKSWFAFKTDSKNETTMVLICSQVCARELVDDHKISASTSSSKRPN